MMRPRVNASRGRHRRHELHGAGEAERFDLSLQRGPVRTVADQRRGDGASGRAQTRDGVEQDVDALDRPQLAHEHQVGRVGCARDRLEFVVRHAVMDDAHQAARAADLAAENVGAVGAFEQEQVAAQHQQAFGRQIEFSGQGVVAEQQAAAMRRIGAHRALGSEREPGIGAAFGAVPVHHVGLGLRGPAHDMGEDDEVARIGVAVHRKFG